MPVKNYKKPINIEKLDLKDKKLIHELDFNARTPYSKLAKKIGLSKQGTEYKLNNLIKKQVITGFYPVINMPKLGYTYCRLSLTLQNITKDKQEEIIMHLNDNKKVFWLFRMHGTYDLLIAIWVKKLVEFKEFIDEIEQKYGEYIKNKNETIATDVIHLPHRYLLGNEDLKEIHIKETEDEIKIDETEKKILLELSRDARLSLVKIAQKTKENTKTIAYRIRKMEKNNLIECYRPIINHQKIGFTYYKLFISLNNVSEKIIKSLKKYIMGNPLTLYIVEGIGLPADLDIEIMAQSNKELIDFIEDIRFRFQKIIGDYQTVMFMETIKVKYFPELSNTSK